MKRNLTGGILTLALLISLFLTGNAFANIYAFVLEKDSDEILINNVDSNTIETIIDLDGTDGSNTDGIITAMATSPGERYLYFVTDNGLVDDGELYQVDLRGDIDEGIDKYTVKKLTSVGIRPKAVVAGINGVYVYVANYTSNTVSVYNRAYASTESITGFDKPVALAVTKGSERGCDVFVANMGNNTVSMFNTYIKVDIALTNPPTDVLVTPDFEYVYVCNSDPDPLATDGRITVIKPVDYYDVDEDGDDIYDEGENEILEDIEITGAKPTKMGMVQGGDYIYAIDPVIAAGDDVTITAGANIMSVIDCSDRMNEINTVISDTLTAGNNSVGIASTKDGTLVYTVEGDSPTVYETDTDDNSSTDSGMYTNQAGKSFQDIILGGDQPLWATSLTAESDTKGLVVLEWKDNNYGATDVLIYRKDHDDESKEYKKHLLDIVLGSGIEKYEDRSVKAGDRYTYTVVPFTAVSRAIESSEVTIKAKDTSDTKICFISTGGGSTVMTGFILFTLAVLALSILARKKEM